MAGLILLLLDIQEFIRHRSVPAECQDLSSKKQAPLKLAIFSKAALTILIKCQQSTETNSPKKTT
jgi:hypothetical protein